MASSILDNFYFAFMPQVEEEAQGWDSALVMEGGWDQAKGQDRVVGLV
jgi:hypothetical protein